MRKLNLKLLLWLMAGTVAAVAAVFAVHYFQSQRIAVALLWQANKAEEQGQTDRQVSYLRRYLDFCPRDVEQKARLGRLLASDYYASNVKMRWQALHVLNSLPPDGDPALRRELVRVALELGGSVTAKKTARDTLASLGLDDKAGDLTAPPRGMAAAEFGELKGYQGQLYELEKEPKRSLEAYRLAVRFAPQEQLNYLRLAWLLRDPKLADADPAQRAKNFDEADQVIDQLVEKNADAKDAYKAYLGRWRYRREFGLIDLGKNRSAARTPLKDAENDVAKALQRRPESAEVLLAEADRLRLWEARADARKVLEKGLELQHRPGYREAADGYRFQFLWQLSNVLLDDLYDDQTPADQKSGRAAEAVRHLGQIRKIKVGDGVPAAADYLEARLALYEKDWARAEQLFLKARGLYETRHKDLTGQIDLYLGKCYEQLGEPGKMYDAFSKVQGWDPSSTAAKLGMAAARWAERTPESLKEAQRLYWSVVETGKLPDDGWLDLARLEVVVTSGQPEPARADWSRAEVALAKAKELRPKAVDVPLLRADMLMAKGDPKGAERVLTDALASEWDKKELIYSGLVELAVRDKQRDKALKILTDAEKELKDRAELRLARARLLVRDDPAKAREALKGLAKDYKQFKPEEQTQLLIGLAEAQFRCNNLNEARRLTRELAELPHHRDDLRLRLLLFDLAQKADDGPDMDRTLEEIAAAERNQGVYHPYARALRLIASARGKTTEDERGAALAEARKLLAQIQAKPGYASWLPLYRARAEIALASGSPDRAKEELKQAVKSGDKSLATAEALVKVLYKVGTSDPEADLLLDTLGPAVRASTEVKRWQVASKVANGDVSQALEMARQLMNDDSKDPADLRWKAWLIQTTQTNDKAQMSKAQDLLDRAMKIGPDEPENYVALVRFFVAARQPGEAPAVMEKARANLKPEKVALTLAQCWEELGRPDDARKEYDRALKGRPNDAAVVRAVAGFQVRTGRLRQAEELLRQLAERKVDASAEDAAWARRGLALVLAGSNDHRNFREALAQVGLTLDANGRLPRDLKADDNTEVQRTRARVLAAQPQRHFREKAVELFEGLESSGGLTPDDRYVLALLYDAAGDWPRAKEKLAYLVSSHYGSPQDQLKPQTAQYMAQYVQGLIRNKELTEAKRWLERLEGVEKQRGLPWGALATADLKARLLEAQGERDKALDLLRDYRKRPGASPQDVTLLLTALARQKRFAEAFDLWPDVCKTCPPEAAGGLSVALLRSMDPKDEQVRQVETWLKQAVKDHPDKPVLRMHLADMYDLRGRYDEALAEYRTVLEVEPGNVVALNNLAWLLAHRTGEEGRARALPLIETAVEGQGRRGDLLDTRGVVLLQLGRTDAALADLKEAVADSKTPSRLFHLARAQQQARDRDGAVKTLREARELGLKANELHPVEQQACRQMLTEFGLQ